MYKYKSPPLDFSALLSELPPLIARKDVPRLLGGLISRGYLQNLDCQGSGPRRIRIGRIIAYTREALVEWLAERAEALD